MQNNKSLYIAGENVKWYSYNGKQYNASSNIKSRITI